MLKKELKFHNAGEKFTTYSGNIQNHYFQFPQKKNIYPHGKYCLIQNLKILWNSKNLSLTKTIFL